MIFEMGSQFGADPPGNVGAFSFYDPGHVIDRAGRTYPQPVNGQLVFGRVQEQILSYVGDKMEKWFGSLFDKRRFLVLEEDITERVDQTEFNICSADINSGVIIMTAHACRACLLTCVIFACSIQSFNGL